MFHKRHTHKHAHERAQGGLGGGWGGRADRPISHGQRIGSDGIGALGLKAREACAGLGAGRQGLGGSHGVLVQWWTPRPADSRGGSHGIPGPGWQDTAFSAYRWQGATGRSRVLGGPAGPNAPDNHDHDDSSDSESGST
jgi:hypothetical protein